MILMFNEFDGEVPRIPSNKLQLSAAKKSKGTTPNRESLAALQAPAVISNSGIVPRTLWSLDGVAGFAWSFVTTVADSPYPGDVNKRLYFIDNNVLRVTRSDSATTAFIPPQTSFRVGVQRPSIQVAVPPVPVFALLGSDVVTGALYWDTLEGDLPVRDLSLAEVSQMLSVAGLTVTPPAPPTKVGPPTTKKMVTGPRGETTNVVVPGVVTDMRKLQGIQARVKVVRGGVTTISTNTMSTGDGQWIIRSERVNAAGASVVLRLANTTTNTEAAETETRAYFVTSVNMYGEESAPSDPVVVEVRPGNVPEINVTVLPDGEYAPVTKVRLYRSDSEGIARVVKDQSIGQLKFLDNVTSVALGERMKDFGGLPPAMQGVVNGNGRYLIGWRGTSVMFSSVGAHGWDEDRRIELKYPVVAILPQGGGFIILTRGQPYVLSGAASGSMAATPIAADYPAVSLQGCCALGGAVAYVSPVGIVLVEGGQVRADFSTDLVTDDQWADEYGQGLSTLILVAHKQSLLLLSPSRDGISIDTKSSGVRRHEYQAQCAQFIAGVGNAVIVSGTTLRRWGAGAPGSFEWASAERDLPSPGAFGVGQIEVSKGTVVLKVMADGVAIHTQEFTTGVHTFRVPADARARRWGVDLSGKAEVMYVALAQTTRELAAT